MICKCCKFLPKPWRSGTSIEVPVLLYYVNKDTPTSIYKADSGGCSGAVFFITPHLLPLPPPISLSLSPAPTFGWCHRWWRKHDFEPKYTCQRMGCSLMFSCRITSYRRGGELKQNGCLAVENKRVILSFFRLEKVLGKECLLIQLLCWSNTARETEQL